MNRFVYFSLLAGGAASAPVFAANDIAGSSASLSGDGRGFNVIFIISDQHKLAVTGCYGDTIVKTPNIDALARTGVTFTRIYTPSPLSAPARAALMTGTYPSVNGSMLHKEVVTNKAGKRVETEAGKYRSGYHEGMSAWAEDMKTWGYATASFGKMHIHGELQAGVNPDYPEGNKMGWDEVDLRFYTSYPGGHYKEWKGSPDYNNRYREIQEYAALRKGNNFNQTLVPTLIQKEEDVFDFAVAYKCCEYLDNYVKSSSSKPFFLYAGLEKPHKPWTTFQRFYDMYSLDEMTLPETWRDWHDNGMYPFVKKGTHNPLTDTLQIKKSMLAYYACVTELDEAVGRIVDETKRLGIYDRTIFVYTTDHGEHLYEHGFHEKHNMFEDAVNIPFIISCPALLPQGKVCNSIGSLIDVLPTIAELIGKKPDPQWQGKSLVSQIYADEPWKRSVMSEFYQTDFLPFPKKNVPLRMYLDNDYKYVYSHGMIDQLYDATGKDVNEMTNLALDPKMKDVVEHYRFLTLAGWQIPFAGNVKADISREKGRKILSWEAVPETASWSVWCSKDQDPAHAVRIGTTSSLEYDVTDAPGKYFWVMAEWNLSRFSERSDTVPMMVQKYPEKLPVSLMITVGK